MDSFSASEEDSSSRVLISGARRCAVLGGSVCQRRGGQEASCRAPQRDSCLLSRPKQQQQQQIGLAQSVPLISEAAGAVHAWVYNAVDAHNVLSTVAMTSERTHTRSGRRRLYSSNVQH